jgi:hypothetical protein
MDEAATGGPALVVPLGGSNFVALEGGKDLRVGPATDKDKQIVEVNELTNKAAGVAERQKAWQKLQPPPEQHFTTTFSPDWRVFEVKGKKLGGLNGAQVTAVDPGSPKKEPVKLRVVVLKPKPVTLSIRPVQVPDPKGPKGGLVYHSKLLRENGFDPKGLLAQLNIIWTPQTNIVFSLGLTTPVPVTDGALIAKALGQKAANASLPELVDLNPFGEMLKGFRDPKADFTLFLVKAVGAGGDPKSNRQSDKEAGVARAADKQGLVGDESVPYYWVRTVAHETGHYVGRYTAPDGTVKGFPDLYSDSNLLMRTGGGGCKIPLEQTVTGFATFNAGY